MKRVAATCFVSGARGLDDNEMRAAVADMIARQYRKRLHPRARRCTRAHAHRRRPRARAKVLVPAKFSVRGAMEDAKARDRHGGNLQLLLRAHGSATKLAEEDLASLLLPPSCRPLPPVIAPRNW